MTVEVSRDDLAVICQFLRELARDGELPWTLVPAVERLIGSLLGERSR